MSLDRIALKLLALSLTLMALLSSLAVGVALGPAWGLALGALWCLALAVACGVALARSGREEI